MMNTGVKLRAASAIVLVASTITSGASGASGAGLSPERQVTAKLGLPGNFMVGAGNDSRDLEDATATHTYDLSTKLDLHYMYLSGLDWPEWRVPQGSSGPPGQYVTKHALAARERGIVPMFTLYQAADRGENQLRVFDQTDFMTRYWRGVRVMFERLGEIDAPAVVHVEPDLWGYAQQKGDDPAAVPMKVGAIVPECRDLPDDVSGMARCVIRLSRSLAPKVVIGLSVSRFGAYTPETANLPPPEQVSDPARIGAYMNAIGAREADLMVVETLDRDAGCFEKGVDPNCRRQGNFYWDESNRAHPTFHEHLAWAKTIRDTIGRPLLWWQMPLGVPADSPGTAHRYRDNRVRYLFSHVDEFVAAGGVGAVFGTGAPNQTTIATDGGQFAKAAACYFAAPMSLP